MDKNTSTVTILSDKDNKNKKKILESQVLQQSSYPQTPQSVQLNMRGHNNFKQTLYIIDQEKIGGSADTSLIKSDNYKVYGNIVKIKKQSQNIINEVINEENNPLVQKHEISTHIYNNDHEKNLVDITVGSHSSKNIEVDTIKHQTMLTSKDSSPVKKDHISSVFETPSRLPQQEIVNNEYTLAKKIDLNAYQSATELRQEVKKLDLQDIQRQRVHRVSQRESP